MINNSILLNFHITMVLTAVVVTYLVMNCTRMMSLLCITTGLIITTIMNLELELGWYLIQDGWYYDNDRGGLLKKRFAQKTTATTITAYQDTHVHHCLHLYVFFQIPLHVLTFIYIFSYKYAVYTPILLLSSQQNNSSCLPKPLFEECHSSWRL